MNARIMRPTVIVRAPGKAQAPDAMSIGIDVLGVQGTHDGKALFA